MAVLLQSHGQPPHDLLRLPPTSSFSLHLLSDTAAMATAAMAWAMVAMVAMDMGTGVVAVG